MKKQREDSHKPILSFKNEVSVKVREENNKILFNGKQYFDEKLFILNIGNNSVYDVHIKFVIDYIKIIKAIRKICINQEINLIGKKYIDFKSTAKNFNYKFIKPIKTETRFFEFIDLKRNSIEIEFPSLLNNLLTVIFYLAREWSCHKEDLGRFVDIGTNALPLKIVLEYKDIGGKKYKKNYKARLDFEYILTHLENGILEENILNGKIILN